VSGFKYVVAAMGTGGERALPGDGYVGEL